MYRNKLNINDGELVQFIEFPPGTGISKAAEILVTCMIYGRHTTVCLFNDVWVVARNGMTVDDVLNQWRDDVLPQCKDSLADDSD